MTRTTRRRWLAGAVAATGLPMAFGVTQVGAHGETNELRFTPIITDALPCSTKGFISWANDAEGVAVTSTVLMKTGDPATIISSSTPTKVGRVNDMIALSPDGKYLYTVSENGTPPEVGTTPDSDGITRLTLRGKDAGKKEILDKLPVGVDEACGLSCRRGGVGDHGVGPAVPLIRGRRIDRAVGEGLFRCRPADRIECCAGFGGECGWRVPDRGGVQQHRRVLTKAGERSGHRDW